MTGPREISPPHSSAIVAHYETLRAAMLGEALPPEARGGLLVLLRRGMWGWIRTLATGTDRRQPIPAQDAYPVEPFEAGPPGAADRHLRARGIGHDQQ